MLRLLNNFIIVLLCAFYFLSCEYLDQFVNLQPIGIKIEPDNSSVLPGFYSPVIISFDTEMKKTETEKVINIHSDSGLTAGDLSWKNNNLYFVPVSGWTAGIRYNLDFTGMISSIDGREQRIDHYISFYAINRDDPPLLEWYSPFNGVSVSVNDVVFEFHFSCSMDRLTVESALTLDGIGNKTFNWSDDGKILKVTPDRALSPWRLYRWTLKDSAKNINGVPLPKSYSGYFTTDIDQILPEVEFIYPVLSSDGCWYPTGTDIETGLGAGHGIAVTFNKPMSENALRSLRFEPSITGRTELLSENSIVFIFTRDPEPEIVYTLIVSGDTRDLEGLKIGADFSINFTVDIPYLNIISLTANENSVIDNFSVVNNVTPVLISSARGELSVSIRFSLPFTNEEKQTVPQKINILPFFPRTLPPVALQYVSWISDDRLIIRWEGLESGEVPNYYKITIPGGKGGINPQKGIYMKEDIIFYLEAVR